MIVAEPCPFCGGTSIYMADGSTYRWKRMECADCGASCGEFRAPTDPDESECLAYGIRHWNHRIS